MANTNDGPVHKSKSLICVPMDSPGVTVFKKIEKIGMHCSDTAQLAFEDVRVPAKNIIGEEGSGFIYQMIQFQQERIFAIAGIVYETSPTYDMVHIIWTMLWVHAMGPCYGSYSMGGSIL